MASTKPGPFRLMDLPPELRNRIYSLALVDRSRWIKINYHVPQPPLLLASKQIREETFKLWYTSNIFDIMVFNCNSETVLAFEQHLHSVGIQAGVRGAVQLRLAFRGTGWENLVEWCRLIWTDDLGAMRRGSTLDPLTTVIYAAQRIASSSRDNGLSWEVCRIHLEALKMVAGEVDPVWFVQMY